MWPETPALDSRPATGSRFLPVVRMAFCTVLARDDGGDGDFFDLGGDSILAVELFLTLRRLTGIELPITAIYDASTVGSLAALLDEGAVVGQRSCVVALRPARAGCTLPPLFVVHGMGGLALTFRDMASRLEDGRAVYGIEPQGLDGTQTPLETVESMAALYLDAVRAIQPCGPYAFAGYSFGGLVAFEMACRLHEQGCVVEPLILLDSFSHPQRWPMDARLYALRSLLPTYLSGGAVRRLLDYYVRRIRALPKASVPAYLAGALLRAVRSPLDVGRAGFATRMAASAQRYAPPDTAETALPALAQVTRACHRAFRAYAPGYLPGPLTIVKAEQEDFLPFSPRLVWRRHCLRVTVRRVPGGHQRLVRLGSASLAAELSACLAAAADEAGSAAMPDRTALPAATGWPAGQCA